MPLKKLVKLAGREFTITELPRLQNMQWRKELSAPLTTIVGEIISLPTMEMGNAQDLASIGIRINTVVDQSLGLVDHMAEALFKYSPELQEVRPELEAKLYDSEIQAAFIEVMKLAFPFGNLVTAIVQAAKTGSRANSKKPT